MTVRRPPAVQGQGLGRPPVVLSLAADDGFAMQVGVTLSGIMDNLNQDRCVRCYLLDGGIRTDNRRRIEAIATKHRRLDLQWVVPRPEESDLGFVDPVLKHLSPAALLRMDLPDILAAEERILYVDTDVLIKDDLAPLHDTPLDGYAIGAVQDFAFPTVDAMIDRMPEDQEALRRGYADLPSSTELFNSGVLVLDLGRCRAEEVSRRAREYRHAHPRLSDQDALNHVLAGRWKPMPPRWNLQTGWHEPDSLVDSYVRQTLGQPKATLRQSAVVHFTGYDKPWQVGSRQPLVLAYVLSVRRSGWFTHVAFLSWAGELYGRTLRGKLRRRREKLRTSFRSLGRSPSID